MSMIRQIILVYENKPYYVNYSDDVSFALEISKFLDSMGIDINTSHVYIHNSKMKIVDLISNAKDEHLKCCFLHGHIILPVI
jgi:ATP-dependent 26S proteasome regulatory subunit